jgi:hypothetical protein
MPFDEPRRGNKRRTHMPGKKKPATKLKNSKKIAPIKPLKISSDQYSMH